jgi:hypothetical protein
MGRQINASMQECKLERERAYVQHVQGQLALFSRLLLKVLRLKVLQVVEVDDV